MFQACQRFGLPCFFRKPLTGKLKWVTNAACREKEDDVGKYVLKKTGMERGDMYVTQRHSWNDSFKTGVRIEYRD